MASQPIEQGQDGNWYLIEPDGSRSRVDNPVRPRVSIADIAGSYAANKGAGAAADYVGSIWRPGTLTTSEISQGPLNLGSLGSGSLDTVAQSQLGPTSQVVGSAEAGSAALPEATSYAPALAGIAGLAGAYNLYRNREKIGTGRGYLQGAASGAGIGYGVAGPIGAGVGAGLGLLGNALGIGHKSRTKGEEHLRGQLQEQGVNIPNSGVKEWENNPKFAQSRNEADLTGKDIVNAAQFYASIPGYDKLDPARREKVAQAALNQGLIRERLGQIEVSPNEALSQLAQSELSGMSKPKAPKTSGSRRDKVKASLDMVKPARYYQAETYSPAPRYDLNPGNLSRNPYL